MVKVVVFDSGLGSLSVIKPIQKQFKCNVIYFADSKNFPYGKKSIKEIKNITLQTISNLQSLFKPELIIVGSNTLSLSLDSHPKNVFTVLPPLTKAIKITKSKSIAILATESVVKSNLLDNYIKKFNTKNTKIIKINASRLVELVECGVFYSNSKLCTDIIKKTLSSKLINNNIDVVILSSTHLPFLSEFLENMFPYITFIDPSESLAKKLKKIYFDYNGQRNSLQVYSSGNIKLFKNKLNHMKIKTKVSKLIIQ